MSNTKVKKSSWIIGGATLVGTGVDFVLLAVWKSGLLFVASVLIGIGMGLLFSVAITRE